MLVYKNQYDFTHGEVSPQLINKSNLEFYAKSSQLLRNVCITPQGGAKRRFGTDFITEISSLSDQYMLTAFDYSEEDSYLLIFTNNNISVYYNDAFQANIVTTYIGSLFEKLEVKYAQQVNSLILTEENHKPAELKRGATHSNWTLSDISFQHLPAVDFEDVSYGSVTFTLDAATVSKGRTLTASSSIFDVSYVGGLFVGIGPNLAQNEGAARITAFVSATQLTVDIISDFNSEFVAGGTIGDNCFLGKPAWSALKGYPKTVTFYEGRMYLGGTPSAPQTVFASVVNDQFNYDEGTSQDDDAFQISILTDRVNTIKHLISDKTLQIFTYSAEFAASQLSGKPLSVDNVSIRQQTANGSSHVRPIVIDNQTLYVNKGGKIVYAYAYDQSQDSYNSINVSLFSSHLIKTPVDGCAIKNSTTNDFEFVFLANIDGTLSIYQSLKDENISAWTLCETVNDSNGKFKRVCAVGENVYFIIERIINGSIVQYLEKLNWDHYTDSTIEVNLAPASNVIPGLNHLIGCVVRVIGDDYIYGEYTVNSSGEVDLIDGNGDPININKAVVGLPYIPLIMPMPLASEAQDGSNMYKNKRIVSAYIDYYDSVGVKIIEPDGSNAIEIPFRDIGETFPYPAPTGKTGFYEIEILSDWSPRQMLSITQDDPLPMTILGIGFKLET